MSPPPCKGNVQDTSSTLVREMYFIEFAKDIAAVAKMPLMVTGGVTKTYPPPKWP